MATDEFCLDETDLEIACPKCATEMVRHDSTEFLEETPEGAILECGACGEISAWEYSLQPRRIRQVRERGGARELPSRALPKGLQYVESPTEIVFVLSWRDVTHSIGVLILAGMFLVVAAYQRDTLRETPLFVAAAGLMVPLLVYGALVQFRNHTAVRATATSLTVEHGPLPFSLPRRRELPLGDVAELECLERRKWFSLVARTKSRQTVTLKSVISYDAGDFIARRVNWFIKQVRSAGGQH